MSFHHKSRRGEQRRKKMRPTETTTFMEITTLSENNSQYNKSRKSTAAPTQLAKCFACMGSVPRLQTRLATGEWFQNPSGNRQTQMYPSPHKDERTGTPSPLTQFPQELPTSPWPDQHAIWRTYSQMARLPDTWTFRLRSTPQEAKNTPFRQLQEKFHTGVLQGVRNISDTL